MTRRSAQPSFASANAPIQIALMAAGGTLLGLSVPILLSLGNAMAFFIIGGLALLVLAVVSGAGARVFLLLLPFILPMDADINFLDQNLRVSLSNVAVLLLCGSWLVELASSRRRDIRFFPGTSLPALAYLVAMALSLWANGGGYPMARLFGPTCDFLLYLYVANALRTERDVRAMVWMLLLGAAVQVGTATAELVLGTELDLLFRHATVPIWAVPVGEAVYSRVSGLMEHANMLAIYLSAIIVFLISIIFSDSSRRLRVACWVGIALSLLLIVDTFSRSAWAVMALFVPGVLLLYLWKLGSVKSASISLLAAIAVVAIAVVSSGSKISDRLNVDPSVMSRKYMMEIGLNVVRDNPILGVGHHNYHREMYRYDDTTEGITTIFPGTLHNIFLLIASEEGLPGLFAFMWLTAAIFVAGLRFLRAEVAFLPNIGLSCWCLIMMFMLFGMANPFPRFTYLYLPLGMLVAISRLMDEAKADEAA